MMRRISMSRRNDTKCNAVHGIGDEMRRRPFHAPFHTLNHYNLWMKWYEMNMRDCMKIGNTHILCLLKSTKWHEWMNDVINVSNIINYPLNICISHISIVAHSNWMVSFVLFSSCFICSSLLSLNALLLGMLLLCLLLLLFLSLSAVFRCEM